MTDTNEDDCFICAGDLTLIPLSWSNNVQYPRSDGGEILCCDNCFRSFHLDCIQENNPPEGDWVCPYCVKLESKNILLCAESKKPIENDESKIKLKCTKCLRLYCWFFPVSSDRYLSSAWNENVFRFRWCCFSSILIINIFYWILLWWKNMRNVQLKRKMRAQWSLKSEKSQIICIICVRSVSPPLHFRK